MTNSRYQDGRHGRLLLVADCQTDMTLFILIQNLILTLNWLTPELTLESGWIRDIEIRAHFCDFRSIFIIIYLRHLIIYFL